MTKIFGLYTKKGSYMGTLYDFTHIEEENGKYYCYIGVDLELILYKKYVIIEEVAKNDSENRDSL